MEQPQSTFILIRDERDYDPVIISAEGLLIGSDPDCHLLLNDETVSLLQAIVRERGGRFYLSKHESARPFTLNGAAFEQGVEVELRPDDVLGIGPFTLKVEQSTRTLRIRVSRVLTFAEQEAVATGLQQAPRKPELQPPAALEPAPEPRAATPSTAPAKPVRPPVAGKPPAAPKKPRKTKAAKVPTDPTRPLDILILRIEEKEKMGCESRLSPRHMKKPPAPMARYAWRATTDLIKRRYNSVPLWAVVGFAAVGIFVVAALAGNMRAFSPAPISNAHTRTEMSLAAALANRPNANSCTTCHARGASMEENCAACHRTEAFVATVTKEHAGAGVGCVSCHAEHRGADFRPALAGLQTCTACHNDSNRKLYNGRRVGTPHGGTFGYPVTGGVWEWEGLDEAELARKPADFQIALKNMEEELRRWPPPDPVSVPRTRLFHTLHIYRVRAPGGLRGNEQGEMSCSSCHNTFQPEVDRDTPRQTCGKCHNGDVDRRHQPAIFAPDQPNCTSCHVEHPRGRRNWGTSLLVASPLAPNPPPPASKAQK